MPLQFCYPIRNVDYGSVDAHGDSVGVERSVLMVPACLRPPAPVPAQRFAVTFTGRYIVVPFAPDVTHYRRVQRCGRLGHHCVPQFVALAVERGGVLLMPTPPFPQLLCLLRAVTLSPCQSLQVVDDYPGVI